MTLDTTRAKGASFCLQRARFTVCTDSPAAAAAGLLLPPLVLLLHPHPHTPLPKLVNATTSLATHGRQHTRKLDVLWCSLRPPTAHRDTHVIAAHSAFLLHSSSAAATAMPVVGARAYKVHDT